MSLWKRYCTTWQESIVRSHCRELRSSGHYAPSSGKNYHYHYSLRNKLCYHYFLRNNPEERSSRLLRGGSLKSRKSRCSMHLFLTARQTAMAFRVKHRKPVTRDDQQLSLPLSLSADICYKTRNTAETAQNRMTLSAMIGQFWLRSGHWSTCDIARFPSVTISRALLFIDVLLWVSRAAADSCYSHFARHDVTLYHCHICNY